MPLFNKSMETSRASLGVAAPGNENLVNMPPPQQKIVAAVYKFRDQTGQYKPSATGANWSTAVTQGSTTILLKSLEESGWFTPIERENLANLLNERKIVRSTRAEAEAATGRKEPALPSLLFAGILLEGGIISYDANVITGGAGLRYFSAGGSGQYREDKVTVYLRAISTSTGEILKTVYTTKTILSQSVDFGLFRYVKFKRLLEAETGFTYNEPSEMAVKEAIDKAVQSLIIEGIHAGYWGLKNKDDMQSPIIKEYQREREDVKNTNVHGEVMANRRGVVGVSIAGGGMYYNGDYSRAQVEPMAEIGVRVSTHNNLGFDFRLGRGDLSTSREFFHRTLSYAELNLNYNFAPKLRHTPYVQIGGGAAVVQRDGGTLLDGFGSAGFDSYIKGGLGYEYLITPRIGIDINASSSYFLNDEVDGVKQGRFNDYFWTAKVGVNFYLGLFKK
ncbi:curli production assembly/transport component CsgG [Rufibacter immobilis]|uniref:Curli production assembly/transport component CsgG n=1 Tax=Rufibacter immobilis TaxID=1348778 RepID=A0A3M9MS71_9BACT|nr:CsgG/HfaB family protein [Rufibacter immobilis]RNI28372.1 curli production assembly/transport component CsgG [Rufibacter immobilis]